MIRSKDVDAAVALIRKRSDERETEFLVAMLEDAPDYAEGEERASLDQLRTAYKEHYDAIWLDGEDDNGRHEADDYHEGYQAGLSYALEALVEVGIELPSLPEVGA